MDKSIKERLEAELAACREEIATNGIRLMLAQKWIGLYRIAFDALRYHGINFYDLKEYKEGYPLGAEKEHIHTSRNKFLRWFDRLESEINAAIRRKSFRQV